MVVKNCRRLLGLWALFLLIKLTIPCNPQQLCYVYYTARRGDLFEVLVATGCSTAVAETDQKSCVEHCLQRMCNDKGAEMRVLTALSHYV